jgi:alpha-L-rhamnosidase
MRLAFLLLLPCSALAANLTPYGLRCEYLEKPLAVEDSHPRLSWKLKSLSSPEAQTAWSIRAASSLEKLSRNKPDLWNSGKVPSADTSQVPYAGKALTSGQQVYWQVRVWDKENQESDWSEPTTWRVALTDPEHWVAQWISAKDETPLHTSRDSLFLPPAHYFRKEFEIAKPVRRATAYLSALGNAELRFNGKQATDAYFLPGWSDYNQRAYYRAFDVSNLLKPGPNTFGAILTDGWYSGYVGYGLLVGYGPHKTGRCMYGKTPSLLTQIVVEFEDGSRKVVGSDLSWKTTANGPILEADMLMGERYDANREFNNWDQSGFNTNAWEKVIPAESNPRVNAPFFDNCGEREVNLGFKKPAKLQAYPGPDVKVTEEIQPRGLTEPKPGVYVYDFGTNFAGIVRIKLHGNKGDTATLRYGEMLHPDGRLMTENLRKARATDTYILKGDPDGEEWSPRFTYHGFQYCELTGLSSAPLLSEIKGLVLHSETALTSQFECSDDIINQLFKNITRTQRANFLEIPTDCPQRDERLGWMGDAQIYVRSATYNADVSAFFTKWLDDVEESQRSVGAYPDYAPYPMGHGQLGKTFGTAWMDAGVICPHTIWKVYGDTRVIERHWASMKRFMEFRESSSPALQGVSIGNSWGDWLNLKDPTPLELIDAAYFAHCTQLMAEMAAAIGHKTESVRYLEMLDGIRNAFVEKYLLPDGSLRNPSQTACVLALQFELVPESKRSIIGNQLAGLIEGNQYRMSTGFLGTKSLLSALTSVGKHSLAMRLFQSREFPSWGYPVVNGATSSWERWDSYTKENGFGGDNNASMNSFSHYAFGAVCQWMFQTLAGIDTEGAGYHKLLLKPINPFLGNNGPNKPIHWVKASYDSPQVQ